MHKGYRWDRLRPIISSRVSANQSIRGSCAKLQDKTYELEYEYQRINPVDVEEIVHSKQQLCPLLFIACCAPCDWILTLPP